eukprot:6804493-Pyramimonas_sp.AAC.1
MLGGVAPRALKGFTEGRQRAFAGPKIAPGGSQEGLTKTAVRAVNADVLTVRAPLSPGVPRWSHEGWTKAI